MNRADAEPYKPRCIDEVTAAVLDVDGAGRTLVLGALSSAISCASGVMDVSSVSVYAAVASQKGSRRSSTRMT